MRGKDRQKKTVLLACLLLLGILFLTEPALAAGEIGKSTGEEAGTTPDGEVTGATEKQRSNQGEDQEEELLREQKKSQESLLEGLELGEMQEAVNELLGEETFSVREALERILSGE